MAAADLELPFTDYGNNRLTMPPRLPADIVEFVTRNFSEEVSSQAISILEGAVLPGGRKPDSRMLRCALASCDDTVEGLKRQVAGLAIDFRDVIVAGEYTSKNGDLVRTQDLSQPFVFED